MIGEKMNIEKFKKVDDGCYYDESECCYENAVDFIQSSLFGFCGCGDPDENLIYIRDSLRLFRDFPYDAKQENWESYYKRYREAVDKQFGSEKSEYFMWYWLDSKGYTEHGGCLPGWLTESGKELLEDLEEITA
jgi:hypothetical protein